jgi:Zn-dependent peptidase ImmA (M78 family)/transcriptional regulator with XRE-family HTH domain
MSFDLNLFSSKLSRYRQQFQLSIEEVAQATGIPSDVLRAYEAGAQQPSGDEILIFADFYKCDFKFFISNERLASFEQTDMLFRKHGDQLSKADRWSIQEFLFLCECESDLMELLGRKAHLAFAFAPSGTYYKDHGEHAAAELRQILGYKPVELTADDVFRDFRRIGLHIFRRKLENSRISGLFLKHPVIGKCVLVNYSEDVYRQRFTAAHEVGHAILDGDSEFNVSFENNQRALIEIRANTFASRFLLSPEMLRKKIPTTTKWNEEQIANVSHQLQVNPQTLAIALKDAEIISEDVYKQITLIKLPRQSKSDPELPDNLSPRSLARRQEMLQRGLSTYYIELCFDAYRQRQITKGRLAEILLVDEHELLEIARLYQVEPL